MLCRKDEPRIRNESKKQEAELVHQEFLPFIVYIVFTFPLSTSKDKEESILNVNASEWCRAGLLHSLLLFSEKDELKLIRQVKCWEAGSWHWVHIQKWIIYSTSAPMSKHTQWTQHLLFPPGQELLTVWSHNP